jgi:hypothetical protein
MGACSCNRREDVAAAHSYWGVRVAAASIAKTTAPSTPCTTTAYQHTNKSITRGWCTITTEEWLSIRLQRTSRSGSSWRQLQLLLQPDPPQHNAEPLARTPQEWPFPAATWENAYPPLTATGVLTTAGLPPLPSWPLVPAPAQQTTTSLHSNRSHPYGSSHANHTAPTPLHICIFFYSFIFFFLEGNTGLKAAAQRSEAAWPAPGSLISGLNE